MLDWATCVSVDYFMPLRANPIKNFVRFGWHSEKWVCSSIGESEWSTLCPERLGGLTVDSHGHRGCQIEGLCSESMLKDLKIDTVSGLCLGSRSLKHLSNAKRRGLDSSQRILVAGWQEVLTRICCASRGSMCGIDHSGDLPVKCQQQ